MAANQSKDTAYDRNVFINCPFDPDYKPLFDAMIFAISACGLIPRSALESRNAGVTRFEKIVDLVRQCRWGIHDISRVELTHLGLPRFNMPLELGLFLGASRLGSRAYRDKSCLVLDSKAERYRQMVSDLAGQDIQAHDGNTLGIVTAVRNFLSDSRQDTQTVAVGGAEMTRAFIRFQVDLVQLYAERKIEQHELTFRDYADCAREWCARNQRAVLKTPATE